MPAPTRLMVSGSGVINSSGTTTVEVGPSVHTEKWKIAKIAVSSTSTAITEARIYRTSIAAQNLVDATYNGNLDTSDTPIELFAPEKLLIVWTLGTAGASCSVRVEGEKTFGARF